MFHRNTLITLGVVIVLLSCMLWAQPEKQDPKGPKDKKRMGEPNEKKMMVEEHLKNKLDATDEEWETLGPLVMKIHTSQEQLAGRVDKKAEAEAKTNYLKALADLNTTLDDPEADPETIEEKIEALRTEKMIVKKELQSTQKELLKHLSVYQEAEALIMGLVD